MRARPSMNVIGTAGHIDHGKSTLVERLTGVNPDRLEQERLRGMTIDLGFASLALPSGQIASIIDVPGHERFVKNMLAGATGIDIALIVVAADEGVMPQTREHLAILHLLGVDRAVVAVTKADLAESDWMDLVEAEISEVLTGTSLEGSPTVRVSAKTGSGIPDLLNELDRVAQLAPDRSETGIAYLPIDRVFSVSGFGTVVTGTLHGGTLESDAEVEIAPHGLRARIRGLQTHDQAVEQAYPGSRVAVNLANVARESIKRGDVLAVPGSMRATSRFEAAVQVVPDAPFSLRTGTHVMLHIGAAERPALVTILGGEAIAAGEHGFARIRTVDVVATVRGEHFIVRVPGPGRTLGGGTVLDPSPRATRRRSNWKERLVDLSSDERARVLAALLPADRPMSLSELASLAGIRENEARVGLDGLVETGRVFQLGSMWAGSEAWNKWATRTRVELAGFHARYPLRDGMPAEELRSKLRATRDAFQEAVRRMSQDGLVEIRGNVVSLPSHRGGTASRGDEAERVLRVLAETPFSPPAGEDLLRAARTDADFLVALAHEDKIVLVGPGLYLTAHAFNEMTNQVLRMLRDAGEITVAQVRDELGTSRKYALALLEHLDAVQFTRRRGDARILGSKAPACA